MVSARSWSLAAPLVLLVGVAACGGQVVADDEPGHSRDGSLDASSEGSLEASTDDAAARDARDATDGWSPWGRVDGDALPACADDKDCEGWARCAGGVCCNGDYEAGSCHCGDGPSCDVRSRCCSAARADPPICVPISSLCGMSGP